MNGQLILLAVFVFGSIMEATIEWYTQIETYPLLAWIGQADFNNYSHEYERRLTVVLYIPYTILMLANLILIFNHPAELATWLFVLCFLLNLSILLVSLLIAVPEHRAHEKVGHVTKTDVQQLLRINLLRLGAATIASVIALGMVFALIGTP